MLTPASVPVPVRVALIESDETLRSLLSARLSKAATIEVVGEAGSAAEALRVLPRCRPDVLVIAQSVSDGTGIDVCTGFRDAGHRVGCVLLVALPMSEDVPDVVDGVALKELLGDGLEREIRRVGAMVRTRTHS